MAPTFRLDGLELDGRRLDASESAFVSRDLERVRGAAFDILYPEFKARSLLPTNQELTPADEVWKYEIKEKFGRARPIRDYSTEFEKADVKVTEAFQAIYPFGDAYQYNVQELRASLKSGKNLPAWKAEAARRAVDELMDDLLLLGGTAANGFNGMMSGLFTLSGTSTYTVPNGLAGDTDWETKIADEIVDDLNGMVFAIVDGTSGVERPDTLVLPLSSYNVIAGKRMGDGSDVTVLRHFQGVNPYITNITWSEKLESNAAWTGKRAVAYKKANDKVEALVGMEFMQHAPQYKNLAIETICEARCGGVVAYYPKSICYADDI